jgi:hypothetical protein
MLFFKLLAELGTSAENIEFLCILSNHLVAAVCVYRNMSLPSKRPRFLQPSDISELFLDTDGGDAANSSDVSSVGSAECVPGVSHLQTYRPIASRPESSRSISSSASDEDLAVESGPGEQIQQAATLQWTRPSFPQNSVAHIYRGPQKKEGQ